MQISELWQPGAARQYVSSPAGRDDHRIRTVGRYRRVQVPLRPLVGYFASVIQMFAVSSSRLNMIPSGRIAGPNVAELSTGRTRAL